MQSLHLIKALKLKLLYGDNPKLYHKIATVMTDRVKLYEVLNRPYPKLENEEQPPLPIEEQEEDLQELSIDKKLLNFTEEDIKVETKIEPYDHLKDIDNVKVEEEDIDEPDVEADDAIDREMDDSPEEEVAQGTDLPNQKAQYESQAEDTGLSEFSLWLLALGGTDDSVDPERLEKSVLPHEEVVSETLANLLVQQGHTERAIKMYEKLSLFNPEKSAYFAQLLEKLKNE